MKVKVLKHKTMKGYHGAILSGKLFRTGAKITPQLYPHKWDMDDLAESVKSVDLPLVSGLDNFELVSATLNFD